MPWAATVVAARMRYVSSDEVRDECIDIFSTPQALLEPTPDTPRLPHETMWMEWRDHRNSALGGSKPGRVGVLVRSDERERSGTAHVVYESPQGSIMAQMRIDFDNPRDTPSELLKLAFPAECQDQPEAGAGEARQPEPLAEGRE